MERPNTRSGRPPNNMSKTRMTLDIVSDKVVARWRGMEVEVKFKPGEVRKAMKEAEELMHEKITKYYNERRKRK